jgi:hypothetical protein
MRLVLPAFLLLAACSGGTPQSPPERVLYAGEGRDRLCLAGERAGLIAYGEGDANCSVRGGVEKTGEQQLTIIPDGDEDCRIDARQQGETIRLKSLSAACDYYCGPGASFDGKAFAKNAAASPAVDFAGDPLCG